MCAVASHHESTYCLHSWPQLIFHSLFFFKLKTFLIWVVPFFFLLHNMFCIQAADKGSYTVCIGGIDYVAASWCVDFVSWDVMMQ